LAAAGSRVTARYSGAADDLRLGDDAADTLEPGDENAGAHWRATRQKERGGLWRKLLKMEAIRVDG